MKMYLFSYLLQIEETESWFAEGEKKYSPLILLMQQQDYI